MRFPLSANLDDDLKVVIHLHEFYLGDRDRQCWTYVTKGLSKYNQQELSLSLLVDDGADAEAFPKTPVRMFQLLAKRVSGDKKIRHGDATKLGQKGIFSFPCAFYVPAIQYPELPELNDTLAIILVHQNEYDYARSYGITRFLARLGRFCSSFPYPTWNTQQRPSLFMGDVAEASLLREQTARAISHSYAHQLGEALHLQLHEDDADAALESLAAAQAGETTVLSTAFSPDCDAGLYWQESQDGPGAYAAPEAASGMIGGSFLALKRADTAAIEIVEDGYQFELPEDQIAALIRAIKARTTMTCEAGALSFKLEHLDAGIKQQARMYEPVAVWRSLNPDATVADEAAQMPAEPPAPKPPEVPVPIVRAGRFINLSEDKNLVERVETEALNNYIHRIESTLLDAMSEESETFTFDVVLTITPARVEADMSHVADLNPDFIAFVKQAVASIAPCKVSAEVRIRIPFSVNDG